LQSHVGYYLVDDGLPELERAEGYRPGAAEWLRRSMLAHPNGVFVSGVVAGTVVAIAALWWLAGVESAPARIAVTLLGLIPATEIALGVVNRFIVAVLPPRILPKLELRETGVPAELRTAVVVPTLFGSVRAVADALETIEVHYLANRDANVHFAILSDFTDSASEHVESDAAILDAAVEGIQALNARYAPKSEDAFFLFHRDRRW